jgi:hypothetical protein
LPTFSPIGNFLDAQDGVPRVSAQAALLLRLRESASRVVPEALLRSASIANYKQGKVVVFADNNATAAKLRLFEPRLIELWGRQGLEISALRVEVQPVRASPASRFEHARLTPHAGRALDELASVLPDESPLRKAVAGLARRAGNG